MTVEKTDPFPNFCPTNWPYRAFEKNWSDFDKTEISHVLKKLNYSAFII